MAGTPPDPGTEQLLWIRKGEPELVAPEWPGGWLAMAVAGQQLHASFPVAWAAHGRLCDPDLCISPRGGGAGTHKPHHTGTPGC